jgi:hypothetical protein
MAFAFDTQQAVRSALMSILQLTDVVQSPFGSSTFGLMPTGRLIRLESAAVRD